jgi:hypothetical protein
MSVGVAQAQTAGTAPQLGKLEQTLRIGKVTSSERIAREDGSGHTTAIRPAEKLRQQLMAAGLGDTITVTNYDFQTNGAMGDRIINWPGSEGLSGILSTVGYMGRNPAVNANRGTMAAIYADLGGGSPSWQAIDLSNPVDIIEPVNSGFNEIDHLSDGRVVNISHNGTTINFMVENAAGTGSFTYTTIAGSDAGFWPRVDVGGNDVIHAIWTANVSGGAPLFYARSTDAGVTFSAPIQIAGDGAISLPNSNGDQDVAPASSGADRYVISAEGNYVAIWYSTNGIGLYQLRSSDNGATWMRSGYVAQPTQVRNTISDSPCDTCLYPDPVETHGDTVAFRTDTASAPGFGFDMLIDASGTIYGVYPVIPTYVVRRIIAGDTAGTIYQTDVSYTDIVARSVWVNANDQFTSQGTIAVPGSLTNAVEFLDSRAYGGGFGRWFQLGMDASNNVYAVFGSGVQSDTIMSNNPSLDDTTTIHSYMRGHLFATWTRDGANWSEPLNLTPNGVDAQYPSLANNVDAEMHIAYQLDTYPGDYLTSSGSGGSTLHPNEPSYIMGYIVPTSSLPEPGTGAVESENTAVAAGAVLGAFPNPTSGRTDIVYSLKEKANVSMRIVNTLGADVASLVNGASMQVGMHTVSFDATTLAAGRYFVITSINGKVIATPLNVAR